MINSLKNMVSQIFYAPVSSVQSTETSTKTAENPFDNPFLENQSASSYGVNKPVKGGYFAGYYNGQPNIVGRKLFIVA